MDGDYYGTDTLHLSAATVGHGWAGNGGRPPGRIALTGSQRSPDRVPDAAENIVAAVHWSSRAQTIGYRDASVVVMHSESSDGRCAVLPVSLAQIPLIAKRRFQAD